jgi:RNA-directed DNA polymerase
LSKPSLLLQKLQTPRSLRKAWKQINRSNPKSYGLSLITIEDFGKNIDTNITQIRRDLQQGTYRFSPIRAVTIPKKSVSGKPKRRGIRVYEIKDRLVQKAICLTIEPYILRKYNLKNEASYAYLKDRSSREALIRMISLYNEDRLIIFEADIEKFFDTVNRKKLLEEMIYPILPDSSLKNLIAAALDQEIGNTEQLTVAERELFTNEGIPQGGGLSPLFANVYLNSFDTEMLKAKFGVIRYADDFIVVCKNQDEAVRAYELACTIIETQLGLKMHKLRQDNGGKTRIVRVSQDKFEFLGVRFNGKRLWPGDKAVNSLKTKIYEITKFSQEKKLVTTILDIKHLMIGWISAYCFCDIRQNLIQFETMIKYLLGRCSKEMHWTRNSVLTSEQYYFSGLPNLMENLDKQRLAMDAKQKLIFSKYWT